jgi:hypothetical protein
MTLSGFTSGVRMTNDFKDTQSIYKALFIYNFATLVDWPTDYRKGNFVIGVYGESNAVYDQLTTKYSGKAIGSQEIKIIKHSSKSQINSKTHILYITEDKSDNINALSTTFKGKSTVLITEKPGYLGKGAIINFVVAKNKQSYEISKSNAKKHKLIIASKLTNLAVKVIE